MYNNPYRLINDMEELYPEFEVPELDLGDLELIEDYSLSIGSRAEASLPDKML